LTSPIGGPGVARVCSPRVPASTSIRRRRGSGLALALLACGLGGCGSDGPPPPALVQHVALAIGGPQGDVVCRVLADGRVACSGRNDRGQLGDGTRRAHRVPVAAAGISTAVAVAVGTDHACALLRDGAVRCWGANDFGQVGDGTGSPEQMHASRLRPTTVKDVSGARAIAVGDEFSCALVAHGHVRCWGNDKTGAMGFKAELDVNDDNYHYRRSAGQVRGVSGARRLYAGLAKVCAVLVRGRIVCWGADSAPGAGDEALVDAARSVAVQADHACAVVAAGRVTCWGYNGSGQLGDRRSVRAQRPAPVRGVTGATAVVTGDEFSCALVDAGRVVCWGGSPRRRHAAPVTIRGLPPATALAAGPDRACALSRAGRVACFTVVR
jgi:alpha-tubulin suppressor-like RCC1 family protein